MRSFEIINEDPKQLKSVITNLVKQTDDESLLNKVYNALKANDVTSRITSAIDKDVDSKKFLDTLTQVVLNTDGTVDEKIIFAENYNKGYVDISQLFSKQKVGFNDFITPGFPQRVFKALVPVIRQGVGPGELALSILSPSIRFTGQESGGGDLQVKGVGFVELKTEQVSGGRWINPRKANMSLSTVKQALEKVTGGTIGPRVNIGQWNAIKQTVTNPSILKKLAKLIADATFNQTDNSMYYNALLSGDPTEIRTAILTVGYANYQAYSKFDGMLIMSIPQSSARYFTDIEDIIPNIKSDSPYILAPEGEMMPRARITV